LRKEKLEEDASSDGLRGISLRRMLGANGLGGGDPTGTACSRAHIERQGLLMTLDKDGLALRHATPDMIADREIVMAAVSQTGSALQYAAEALKADREIVSAACRSYSPALEFADPALACDKDFILDLISQVSL
jgi:hypothetical protein